MTDKEVYDSISKSFPILSAVVVKDGSQRSDCRLFDACKRQKGDCVVTVDAGLVGEFSEYVKKGLPFAVGKVVERRHRAKQRGIGNGMWVWEIGAFLPFCRMGRPME